MQKKVKLLFLVVLYEQDFKTSETLKTLINLQSLLKEVTVFLWDNSKLSKTNVNEINLELPQIKAIEYHSDTVNTPLSKIYNYIFDEILSGFDYITLLDHDSHLNENFIIELLSITNQDKYNLILPKIIANKKLISPAKLYYFKGIHFKKISGNLIKANYITAINSGMTIKASYIVKTKFRYDENLKFYGTDDNFMKSYCTNENLIYVLSSKINHTLNYFTKEPILKKVWRFKQMMYGTIYLNGDNFFLKLITSIYVFLLSVKESIRNKSFKFIYFGWKN